MLKLNESTRENPTKALCECGVELSLVLHHDFLETSCHNCNKTYTIKVNEGIWNCCAIPENPNEMVKRDKGEKMGFHICYPLRADNKGFVYCKHCRKLLSKEFPRGEDYEII